MDSPAVCYRLDGPAGYGSHGSANLCRARFWFVPELVAIALLSRYQSTLTGYCEMSGSFETSDSLSAIV